MIRIFLVLGLMFWLVACIEQAPQHSPEQEIPLEQEPNSVETKAPQGNPETTLEAFSQKAKAILVKNEYGGGDCLGTYTQYQPIHDTTLVTDYLDCGEYGFTLKVYLIQEKRPLITRKISKEWIITDSIPYTLQEWCYDFSDSTQYNYREYKYAQYKDSEIPASIPFDTIQQENGSLFLKDFQETLAKETEKLME